MTLLRVFVLLSWDLSQGSLCNKRSCKEDGVLWLGLLNWHEHSEQPDDSHGMIMQSVSIDNVEVEGMSRLSAVGGKGFFYFFSFHIIPWDLGLWIVVFFMRLAQDSLHQFIMRFYMDIHTCIHTHKCACVCKYSCPGPAFIRVLCSKRTFKDFLSLTSVDLFMSILPPVLRHTEFVRLVLTLPQGVRKCLSYLYVH